MFAHLYGAARRGGGVGAVEDFFFNTVLGSVLLTIGETLLILVPVLMGMAYATYFERKALGAFQLRRGPNRVGPFGLWQPFADAVKVFTKETIIPAGANRGLFLLAPMITFVLACLAWAVIPVYPNWAAANINVGILYLFAISSLGVYGVIVAGWASNSKYAFLGAMRSAAQMVSYEVSIGFVLVSVLMCVGSLNLNAVVQAQSHVWFCFPMLPMFVVFLVSMLAECNRAPFDLPEGESEIVAGFFVEYSAMAFALFYLGEYTNMIMMSALASILFLGGWQAPFGLTFIPGVIWLFAKVCLLMFFFFWVRATFPRYRYDQLMRLGWKIFLPLSLVWLVLTAGYLEATGTLPVGGG
jgi:NADH-quinone oxidoreductase subunit H